MTNLNNPSETIPTLHTKGTTHSRNQRTQGHPPPFVHEAYLPGDLLPLPSRPFPFFRADSVDGDQDCLPRERRRSVGGLSGTIQEEDSSEHIFGAI